MKLVDPVDLRRETRRLGRLARRVAVGSWGLSPAATASWSLHRARPGLPPGVEAAENSSFTWVEASDHRTTVVWLHNYWSWGYGTGDLVLHAALVDDDGHEVAAWDEALVADATARLDVRDRCRTHGVALPFEGQLLLRLRHQALVAGRPVQVFAEYVDDSGDRTGVHGQYGLMSSPLAQVVSAMRVEGGGARTAVAVTNPYDGPGRPHDLRAAVEVCSADGATRRATVHGLAPHGTEVVWLDELFPGLDELLGGRPGHVRVTLPCPSSRLATWIDFPDGRRIVNHGTVDRVFDQRGGVDPGWRTSHPVASVPVVADGRRDTVLGLANVWGPVPGDYDVTVEVFRADGSPVTTHRRRVPRQGFREVALGRLATEAGEDLPFTGHAQVGLAPADGGEAPSNVDVLVGLVDDGRLAGEVQVGGEFFNAEVPEGLGIPDIRRTRVFARVEVGPGDCTRLFLANPGGADGWDGTARPLLHLLHADGHQVAEAAVDISPHGCASLDVAALFGPEAVAELGPDGHGVVRVRDTTARLYGYTWVERDGAATLAIDHLVGG